MRKPETHRATQANLQHHAFFSAGSQPDHADMTVEISIPELGRREGPARITIQNGEVHVRAGQLEQVTELLDSTRLLIRGSNRSDRILLDLRDPSVLQLDRVVVNAGRGHDFVRVLGVHPEFEGVIRINGQQGNDLLRGQNVDAVLEIFGGGGRDRLFGGNNNDRLVGGRGNDFLRGGAGNDRLSGGEGRDRIDGDSGEDELLDELAGDFRRDSRSNIGPHPVDHFFSLEVIPESLHENGLPGDRMRRNQRKNNRG